MEQNKIHTFTSRDGVEYHLTIVEDIIRLTPEQISKIGEYIKDMLSSQIESEEGVSLHLWRNEQIMAVQKAIESVLGDRSIETIEELELVDTTSHAKQDRINQREICIDRNWNPDRVEKEIINCLKTCYGVEQVRIRFSSKTKCSWPHFTFRIKGFKNEKREEGQLVTYFKEDPLEEEKVIMVVTILTS
jgi:copper chaperone CopZ